MKENLKWEKANNHLKEMMKKHPEIFDDEWFENYEKTMKHSEDLGIDKRFNLSNEKKTN